MEINKLTLYSNDIEQRVVELDKMWTIISSGGKNSQGKSTIVRSLLYGLGLILKNNFVDGTKIENFTTKIEFDNGIKILRGTKSLTLINDTYKKEMPINDIKDVSKIIDEYKIIFSNDWEFISSYLFANYSDQQFGVNVVNRGRTGPFPTFLNFSIEKMTGSLDNEFAALSILKKEKKKLLNYENDLDFIKDNVEIVPNQIKFNVDFDETLSSASKIRNLKMDISSLKTISAKYSSKINALEVFEKDIPSLNLFYLDDKNVAKPLTIKNFKDSSESQKSVLTARILSLQEKITNKEEKIRTLKEWIDEEDMISPDSLHEIKEMISRNRVKIAESKYKNINKKQKKLEDGIRDLTKSLSLKQLDTLKIKMKNVLASFAEINTDISIWLTKHKGQEYEIFLNEKSKFTTYVGAIRFILSTSFKFAISDYLWDKGIKLPIIIDNLFPEELDINVQKVYIKELQKLKQRKIIATIDEKFLDLFEKPLSNDIMTKILVKKNNFKDEQITIFSTVE